MLTASDSNRASALVEGNKTPHINRTVDIKIPKTLGWKMLVAAFIASVLALAAFAGMIAMYILISSKAIVIPTNFALGVACGLFYVLAKHCFDKGRGRETSFSHLTHPFTHSKNNPYREIFSPLEDTRSLRNLRAQIKPALEKELDIYQESVVEKDGGYINKKWENELYFMGYLNNLVSHVGSTYLIKSPYGDYTKKCTDVVTDTIKALKNSGKAEEFKKNCEEIVKKWSEETKNIDISKLVDEYIKNLEELRTKLDNDINKLKAQNKTLVAQAKEKDLLQDLRGRAKEHGEEFEKLFNDLINLVQELERMNGESIKEVEGRQWLDNGRYNNLLSELQKYDGEAKKLVDETVALIDKLKEFNKNLNDIRNKLNKETIEAEEKFKTSVNTLFDQVAEKYSQEIKELATQALSSDKPALTTSKNEAVLAVSQPLCSQG